MKKFIGAITIILGIISGITFFSAGSHFDKAAENMKDLRSQAGNTVAEAYYHEVGGMTEGLGALSEAFGIGIIAMSLGLGTKFIIDETNKKGTKVGCVEKQDDKEDSQKLGL